MKNSIFILSIAIIIFGGMLSGCQSQAVKEEIAGENVQAKDNVTVAKRDLKVQQDTITAYQKFILESENQITAFEKNIDELKVKIAQTEKREKARYEKKLQKLEMKNNELKANVVSYKNEQVDNWEEIQVKFNKDLDELGNAIAGFFVKD